MDRPDGEAAGSFAITDHCIGCGLCATVCTARRPLVQLLELAREELRRADRAREAEALAAREAEAREGEGSEKTEVAS